MSFGGSFFGAPQTVLRDLEVDGTTIVVDETNDRVGIGDAAPGTTLQLKGTAPYVTLQNSTAENTNGGCEAKIIFEDHANASLGQIEVSHSGTSDDTKGKMVLSTHTGSTLTAAVTIDEAQKVTAAGDVQVTGDIILDDGGSLKEAGGTAAITFDGSGHVTKIGQDSPSSADVLTYDGSKWVASAPTVGDITGVTAGVGLSGGGATGALTLTLDLSELSDVTPANGDKLATLDSDGANEQLTTVAGLATLFAGTGLTASSSVIGVDASQTQITSVGALNAGSITSGFTSIDVGSGAITTTGTVTAGDFVLGGGDLSFGNDQNATVTMEATAHNAAGKTITVAGGAPAAGTTNNIAGGSVTIKGGQGKGSGAGGDIVFQTANAAGSGSSLNSLATALTISDDKSATFTGDVVFAESTSVKCGSNAILSDSSGTMTLSNVDALDATTEATIEAAIDTLSNLASVGTITTGVWQGTAIASAYLDADTAHLSGAQTFTGTKTLNSFKGTGATTVTTILDEDAMGTNSATALATQQSIKAYADTKSVLAGSSSITTVGTVGTGTWQGTAVASAYLDADTAHLSGTQTFTGTKTFNSFKGTGGATVTNILDEDAMGSNSATALATQQSIKAYVTANAGTAANDGNLILHMQVFS